jgi:Ser/Thr protein kinase RdoA (MazF antagonist)
MHEARIFHGDFHLRNVLFDGEEWVLIDLDGLRHLLRRLQPVRLAEQDWSRTWIWLAAVCGATEDQVRPLFEVYLKETRLLGDGIASWRRICRRVARTAKARG